MQSSEKKDNLFDGVMETIFWVGPYKDFISGSIKIPALQITKHKDKPFFQYKCNIYKKSVIIFYYGFTFCLYIFRKLFCKLYFKNIFSYYN